MVSCGDKEPSSTEGNRKCSQLSSVSPTLFPLNILEPIVMHLLLLLILMICVSLFFSIVLAGAISFISFSSKQLLTLLIFSIVSLVSASLMPTLPNFLQLCTMLLFASWITDLFSKIIIKSMTLLAKNQHRHLSLFLTYIPVSIPIFNFLLISNTVSLRSRCQF